MFISLLWREIVKTCCFHSACVPQSIMICNIKQHKLVIKMQQTGVSRSAFSGVKMKIKTLFWWLTASHPALYYSLIMKKYVVLITIISDWNLTSYVTNNDRWQNEVSCTIKLGGGVVAVWSLHVAHFLMRNEHNTPVLTPWWPNNWCNRKNLHIRIITCMCVTMFTQWFCRISLEISSLTVPMTSRVNHNLVLVSLCIQTTEPTK